MLLYFALCCLYSQQKAIAHQEVEPAVITVEEQRARFEAWLDTLR